MKFPFGSPAPPSRRRARGSLGASAIRAAKPRSAPIRRRSRCQPAPADAIAIVPLELEARDGEGRVLSRNALEFCVVPPLARRGAVAVPHRWRGFKRARGDRLAEPRRDAPRKRGRRPRDATDDPGPRSAARRPQGSAHRQFRRRARSIRTAICRSTTGTTFPSMLLRERAGTPWDGQWMGAFSWRRTDGPWAGLPGGPMLDEHWSGLLPNHVLTGFPSTAFGGLVDAGMAVGWLHHAAAFVKRSFLGKAGSPCRPSTSPPSRRPQTRSRRTCSRR